MRHSLATSLVVVALLPCSAIAAQRLEPKRAMASVSGPGCAPSGRVVQAVVRDEGAEVRRLIASGQEAAIVGEHITARDAFARAASLSPGNARIAYYLGREFEELGERAGAVREYCRYLALGAVPDSEEVRRRIVRLAPTSDVMASERALASFRTGVAAFDRRRLEAAETAFTAVVQQSPTAPEGFFNRALVLAERGDRGAASRDLSKYLELRPGAPDEAAVRAALLALQSPSWSPTAALAQGLIVPGLGQFYTRRSIPGLAVMAVAAGGVVVALRKSPTTEIRQFVDPFGFPYADTLQSTERKQLAVGAAVAAAAMVGSAIEAALFARRSRERATGIAGRPTALRRVDDVVEMDARVRLHVPVLSPDRAGVGVRVAVRF